MRVPILAATFAFATMSAAAGEPPRWVIEQGEEGFRVTSPDYPDLAHSLDTLGGHPAVVSWEVDYRYDDIGLLHYYGGEAGTSTMVAQYRIAVVDLRDSRVIGDVPYYYIARGAHPDVAQPKVRWLPDALTVVDETNGGAITVSLRPAPGTPEYLFDTPDWRHQGAEPTRR